MMIKKFIPLLAISTLIAILFLGFLYFVGIPKTRARNFYNLALEEERNDNKEQALKYLNIAKYYWSEKYIELKINELRN